MFFRRLVLAAAIATPLVASVVGCAMTPASTATATAMPQARAEVAAAAERLRTAMIDPTAADLSALVADDLSYGHSGGRVDTKASFIADLVAGRSDFVTIAITDQTVTVVDATTAIVRHALAADTMDSGKPAKVSLKILGVWQKQNGQWKLLARQAVRV